MVRIGRREFAIPLWLWVAIPLALVLYVCVNTGSIFRGTLLRGGGLLDIGGPDHRFLNNMRLLAIVSFTGFLLVDLTRRSRMPWYGLPFLLLASLSGAILVTGWIGRSLEETIRVVVGVALMAVGGKGGTAGLGLALWGALLAVALGLAMASALIVTLASRFLVRQPLLARATLREYGANVLGAGAWLAIAFGGYWAIRSSYGLALGYPASAVPAWLPLAAAGFGAFLATAVQLYLAHRNRRRQPPTINRFMVLPAAIICVASYLAMPDLFGLTGYRAYNDYVRPAMRAVHLLPTPTIMVAGYKINVPFHDLNTRANGLRLDGGAAYVSVRLPQEYGLTSGIYAPVVVVYRRDIGPNEISNYWLDRRKVLEERQAQQPGQDVVARFPGSNRNALALRTSQYLELDFQIADMNPATSWETAEQVLRRFLQERLQRIN